jgi:hypothetical protein
VATARRTTTPQPRLEVKLRSRRALQDAMHFGRLTIRDLATACGDPKLRSTIGHLHSGHRSTCSPHLARKIETALHLYPNSLFELRVTGDMSVDTPRKRAA